MDFKGSQFERDIILWGVRWYVAYPISYRQLDEMMQERGVEVVDHSSLHRWVLKYTPALDKAFRQRKRAVGIRWRLDETYMVLSQSLFLMNLESCRSLNLWCPVFDFARKTKLCDRTGKISQ